MSADDDRLIRIAAGACPPGRVGVAVSGGSDSMAALHLLHAAGCVVEAITVDHLLRPEAAQEAVFVKVACAALGIPHEILHWTEAPDAQGNLMAEARKARYRLIAGWALHKGLRDVVVAHTGDDVAETFLMRLARHAGIDGLSSMRDEWPAGGITFRRPFLGCTRAELRGFLQRRGIGWIDDPSNDNPQFERVRARQVLAQLAPLGIDTQVLAATAMNLRVARNALGWCAWQAARDLSRIDAGDILFRRQDFYLTPLEIQRRLLQAALRLVGGDGYPPREESMLHAEDALRDGKDHTLAGVRMLSGADEIRFTRELNAVAGLMAPAPGLWDGRWALTGPAMPGQTIRALGEAGLALCKDWRATGLLRASLLASPSVWEGDRLVAAPLAGWPQGWTAELAEGRNSLSHFLLSH